MLVLNLNSEPVNASQAGQEDVQCGCVAGRCLCLDALVEDTRVALQVGRKYFGPFLVFFFV